MTTWDKIAAAVIGAILLMFPVLQLAGIVSLSADDLAKIGAALAAISTAGGLIFQAVKASSKAPGSNA